MGNITPSVKVLKGASSKQAIRTRGAKGDALRQREGAQYKEKGNLFFRKKRGKFDHLKKPLLGTSAAKMRFRADPTSTAKKEQTKGSVDDGRAARTAGADVTEAAKVTEATIDPGMRETLSTWRISANRITRIRMVPISNKHRRVPPELG